MGVRSRVLLGVVAVLLSNLVATNPAVAQAGPERAPSAPRAVTALADADSVTISWRPPRSAAAGKIDRYQVARSATGLPKRRYTVAGSSRSLDVTGLLAGPTYWFTLRAHNQAGWGRASSPVPATLVTIPTATPPDPPDPPTPPQPLPGFGIIAGPCGMVAPQLALSTPSQLDNRFDFLSDPFDPLDLPLLTPGAQAIYDAPSTGGSATLSQVFAFETLARCEGATLVKTESEIGYQDGTSPRTDLLVQIGVSKVGVMVARAFRPPPVPFTQADATTLVTKKLDDVNQSSLGVVPADAWVKQVLVVMAIDSDAAQKIRDAWLAQPAATKADTVVYVVTTDGADAPLY